MGSPPRGVAPYINRGYNGLTRNEVKAYNAGVRAVLDLARRSADALEAKLVERPTRYNFAVGALHGLAEEGAAMMLPEVNGDDAVLKELV